MTYYGYQSEQLKVGVEIDYPESAWWAKGRIYINGTLLDANCK